MISFLKDNVRLSLKIVNESLLLESNDKLKIAGLKFLDKFINNQYQSLVFKEQMENHLIQVDIYHLIFNKSFD
jgi:hypothetical protein